MIATNVPTIVALAAVVILGSCASVAQSKSAKDYENQASKIYSWLRGDMVCNFSIKVYKACRDKEAPEDLAHKFIYAERLGDESSAEYKCAVRELEKGEDVLDEVVKQADPEFFKKLEVYHYDRIRSRIVSSSGQEKIEAFVKKATDWCKEGIDKFEPLINEALKDNAVAESKILVSFLERLNTCKVLKKNGVSKQAMSKLGKWAANMYKHSEKMSTMDKIKDFYRRQKEFNDDLKMRTRKWDPMKVIEPGWEEYIKRD